MKFTKILKIAGLVSAVAGLFALAVYAQPASESRSGFTTISVGGSYFPRGQTVVVSAVSTNCTNIAIIPNDSPVKNDDPNVVGAQSQVVFLDSLVQTPGQASTPIENLVFFYSTNRSSVFAGDDAASNPRTAVTGANSTNVYTTNTCGAGSNIVWLAGVVNGLVTNQWVVVKHQGVIPTRLAYEPALVSWTNVVYYTNSFTNGANQTTSVIYTNTVVCFQPTNSAGNGTVNALRNQLNSGDQLWFETTNYTMLINTHSPLASSRLTLSAANGVASGERGDPLMIEARGTNITLSVTANFIK